MGRYQAYPDYKDSGVEWLGVLPSDWEISQIKYLCFVNDGNHGEEYPKESDYTDLENGVAFIRGGNLENFSINDQDMLYITKSKNDSMRKGRLMTGDILFVNRGDIGKLALISESHAGSNLNSQIAYLRCLNGKVFNKFLLYFLAGDYISNLLRSMKMGSVLTQFPIGNILEISVPLPCYKLQVSIANFLDHETAKIDTLIEQQQQLIQLLKEKRQAVISHAVTKGLNPDAPMKDSGVEWLGEVPAHWRIGKCGFYISILSGFAFPSSGFSDNENDTKLLRGINVGVSHLKWNETVYWKREPGDGLDIYEMKAGDLVIGMDRPLISEGIRVAKVIDSDLPCLLLQRVASLKTGNKLDSDYLFAYLSSEMFASYFSPDTTGVSVPHISPDQISNFVIAIPPINEQRSIAEYLHVEKSKFKSLIEEAELANVLLQERRTALISAAVTGKIDVRNWQAPQQ